jgi:multiple sugar transport system substrate-binding protein
MKPHRLASVAGIVAVTTALTLAGCAASPSDKPSSSDDDAPITLTMSWWGNDTRSANTTAIIKAFEEKHPNVTIEPSFTDYSSYWDRIATQTAAGDAPDIMQFDEPFLSSYADKGALLDLTKLGVDTSGIPKSALDSGVIDGKLYALASGAAAYVIFLNPAVFEKAGVPVPDDPKWTWDDFVKTATEVTKAGGGAYAGFTSSWGFDEGSLRSWARQHDEQLFTKSGKIGVSKKTMSSYFAFTKKLIDDGASPAASVLVEQLTAGLSDTAFATGKAAMGTSFNSQITALQAAVGNKIEMLPVPESAKDYFIKPSADWVGSSRTKHPKEVAEFIDFMVNSKTQADIQGTERGIPNNQKIAKYLSPKLSETDQAAIAFLSTVKLGAAESVTPPGGNQFPQILQRYAQQVVFGQISADKAAEGFIQDLQQALDDAR